MFISADVVTFIFRIINFLALIGLSFFVYQKYIKKNLFDLIEDKKNNHDCLCRQQAFLEKRQIELDAQVKSETILCEKFKSNIDQWKETILCEQDQQKEKQAVLLAVIKKRHVTIAADAENQRIQDTVAKAVVAGLEESLSTYFADAQRNKTYLNGIIDFMNERKS
jgi:hypothetical protein